MQILVNFDLFIVCWPIAMLVYVLIATHQSVTFCHFPLYLLACPLAGSFSLLLWGNLAENEGWPASELSFISSRIQVLKLGRSYGSWLLGEILWSRLRQKHFIFPRSPFSVMRIPQRLCTYNLVCRRNAVLSMEANSNGVISLPKEVSSFLRVLAI